ncbi:MAG: NADH-quinone oxidoreductase subunit A [Candidatus Thermoplasmatota archaeon]|jgi:NADH:ubiquinone oxidoreductase subunit 3 (subunit A)|nr:hypothetical protein [Euryarchaeota archaeon]MAM99985.1 hypothetical protein [Euryarchaeota archaeon]MBO53820.1 hypothetical protein [Euryarchaeota archaeon]MED5451756.1 NADH-quinone oxidoreductase subunit A [Candidatus Thermoplasmatota archaeon]|tara:strand:+ start:924 stop:1370 length:447 start_codon:yes stop_codon:yes gene_type:complete
MTSVPEAYIAVAAMTLVGIGFPVGSFIAAELLRPRKSPNDPTKLRSWLLPGYESDQSLYIRRDSTYECGAEPLGEAHINFHFQYYWYAIIFLVFDIAFMFLAFGGVIAIQDGMADSEMYGALATLTVFTLLMGLGVWHVFRKRGRIYI